MIPNKSRNVPPKASVMIEALRGLGYTAASALADLIDNSISAHATDVALAFFWDESSSRISILDNGDGMDDGQLERAMRLGDRSPLEARAASDLGRFGLGLKTASFSQCRRLTVASKKDGTTSCLRWDLDILAASEDGGWHLLEGGGPGSHLALDSLNSVLSGTLVLWEVLDRIASPGFTRDDFLNLLSKVEQHLAMVFHRYLAGPHPKLRLMINGRPVDPWDPFLVSNSATWSSPVDRLRLGSGFFEVQCHVLPHKDRLSVTEHQSAGGPDGWTAQQGFYVYRNERLLVAGNWLGLGQPRPWTKEEAHRLARIRLDIPNTADTDWKIDIRKSTARPPKAVRNWLTRLAEDTRGRARRVFAHRGQAVPAVGGQLIQAWRAEHFRDSIRYRIDVNHPAVKSVLEEFGHSSPQIVAMLRVIEETVPVQRIWLDTTESRETPRTGFSGSPPAEVAAVLNVMYRNLIGKKGLSSTSAREQLLRTEPFHNYAELVKALPDIPDAE
jgi:Histidine kinase-, DNA gyrase B-, and HSP90-like ATPase